MRTSTQMYTRKDTPDRKRKKKREETIAERETRENERKKFKQRTMV